MSNSGSKPSTEENGKSKSVPGENGNGQRSDEPGEQPEFFLIPLLASDPLPYLFDGEGNPVDAEGVPISDGNGNGNGVPAAIRKLQEEVRPRRSTPDA